MVQLLIVYLSFKKKTAILKKTAQRILEGSLYVEYISQHAIRVNAGHMTKSLSTWVGTAVQGSSWTTATSDLQTVFLKELSIFLFYCVKILRSPTISGFQRVWGGKRVC